MAQVSAQLTTILRELWWTRLQPIRTAAEVALDFAIFTHEPFKYQRIGAEVRKLRALGMTLQAIGRALEVDEKTVRKILRPSQHPL